MQPDTAIEPTFYTSVFHHGVDEKRRVQVPAKWRSAKPSTLTLIVWPEGELPEACLLVLPPARWFKLVARLEEMPFQDPAVQVLRRLIGAGTERVNLDKAGRLCLPEEMARIVGIAKEATLVGLVDRFQIWSPERYEQAKIDDQNRRPEAFKLI